ncbi:MAG: hypothetical protein WCJ24_01960 [Candidatus Saccharibacteria bacterium]
MTATNHAVTGALVATFVHIPVLAIPLAFASHFALDALPHFDYPASDCHSLKFFIWLVADIGFALSILTTLLILKPPGVYLLLTCSFVSMSPDLMWAYYISYKRNVGIKNWPRIAKFHKLIQTHTNSKLWPVEMIWFITTGTLLASRLY